jgi:hypothetical protein
MKKPDQAAHVLGVLGFALSVVAIGWQVFVYRDAQRDHIITRVTAVYHTGPYEVDRDGDVFVEVVNDGQHPLYLRDVELKAPTGEARQLYGSGSEELTTQDTSLKMEPGETRSSGFQTTAYS